ncbi:MAG: LysM peptidoglycan-binding domain-containing protein [Acidimicrobiia bacterium]|nr:LysM peptidoglycan-binding domain-containing protein [Acidimicrobiia bacterium]
MTRTASMPTSRASGLRSLFLILTMEIGFIVGLHYLGSLDRMQIDFSQFSRWLDITSPEVALTASIRMFALVLAYWVLATSVIYLIARTFKIPAMLRAMEFATIPFVRKAIDGALAATIIGGTVFGGASAVFAHQDASKVAAPTSVTTTIKDMRGLYTPGASEIGSTVGASTIGEIPVSLNQPDVVLKQSVGTVDTTATESPGTVGENIPVPSEDVLTPTTSDSPSEDIPVTPKTPTSGAPSVVVPSAPTTNAEVPITTPKTTVPVTTQTPQPVVPSPGVIVGGEKVERTNDAPSKQDPAPTTTESTTTTDSTSYTVVSGDNFWNIAKVHVEQNLGHSPTNAEVANYWVKLIDANRANIRSGDADLIFPGEVFSFPAI